ncbi:hemerythrin domain-containing protein [Microbispora sp. CA-135349]|uniref:hemerythrin domain-containing protein n=1 Tax=Microbispora sp. CA-135349 TaxID=3239953 RepID=UPI003D8B7922
MAGRGVGTPARGGRRRELFNELVRLPAVHESAEEQVVHPAARSKAGDEVVEARLHEEDEAKHALSDLYDLGVDHPEFDTRLAALEKAVVEHATHEEREEFPRLRRETSPERLRRRAGAVRAPRRSHPPDPTRAPGSPRPRTCRPGRPWPCSTRSATPSGTGGSRTRTDGRRAPPGGSPGTGPRR